MKKNNLFWIGYSDLMTSLFFIMLVLFVVTIVGLNFKMKELKTARDKADSAKVATEKQLEKIREIDESIKNIDPKYFIYDSINKKHVLNIDVQFGTNISDMSTLSDDIRVKLRDAGHVLENKMKTLQKTDSIKYLIIIEGQASKDNSPLNDNLSYSRAIALRNFWFGLDPNLNTVLPNCEVIIAGSGQYGVPRIQPDKPPANQRFLITIIPKIGKIETYK